MLLFWICSINVDKESIFTTSTKQYSTVKWSDYGKNDKISCKSVVWTYIKYKKWTKQTEQNKIQFWPSLKLHQCISFLLFLFKDGQNSQKFTLWPSHQLTLKRIDFIYHTITPQTQPHMMISWIEYFASLPFISTTTLIDCWLSHLLIQNG